MMITTIQIHENVKKNLDRLKKPKTKTYEAVIVDLLKSAETTRRNQEQLLIEGCKAMAKENIKITKEFEAIKDFANWEW